MVDMCCPEAPVAAVLFRRKAVNGVKYVARNPVAADLGMRQINKPKLNLHVDCYACPYYKQRREHPISAVFGADCCPRAPVAAGTAPDHSWELTCTCMHKELAWISNYRRLNTGDGTQPPAVLRADRS